MSDALVLGIDVGTASSKAVLARGDGTVVATAERAHELSLPRPGWAEHDADAVWWHDVTALCRELLAERPPPAAVCVSGIGPCVVLCDDALRPLGPAILYGIDTRAVPEAEELQERIGEDALLARGGSLLTAQALGPKLLWLRRNRPEAWTKAAGWYMASSFVVARLTGAYVLDHHSASQCDPLYDLAGQQWADDVAAEVAPGVPLPELAWPGDVVGRVHKSGAATTGIPEGTPVLAGTIDAWAEAFSVGVQQPGDLMLMYGSTMFLVQVVAERRTHRGLWATTGVEPGTWSLAAGMATSGSLTAWLRDLAGGVDFGDLAAEAGAAPAGADGLLVLPYFAGERSPIFDAHARGVIAGLTLAHSRGHIARAFYEAIALGVRHNLETMTAAARPAERVVAVGGGTRGGVWTQIVSDVTGLEQLVPRQTIGAAYGDARLAAQAAGLATGDWTEIVATVAPTDEHGERYDELYGLYRELYPATAPICHRLATLQEERR